MWRNSRKRRRRATILHIPGGLGSAKFVKIDDLAGSTKFVEISVTVSVKSIKIGVMGGAKFAKIWTTDSSRSASERRANAGRVDRRSDECELDQQAC